MNIFLDFDIGGDVDDMMCLALLLSRREFDVTGITTTLGNVWERANETRVFLEAAGRGEIPVACGCSATMGPYFRHEARKGYDEWARSFQLCPAANISTGKTLLNPVLPMHGVDFMIDTVLNSSAPVFPVLTGTLTNMAMAFVKDARVPDLIPKLGIMGGEFFTDMAEHNIKCDAVAAEIVFSSGVEAEVIPFQIGIDCRLTEMEMQAIGESDDPALKLLYQAMLGWQKHCVNEDSTYTPCLFDPCVAVALLHPEFFDWQRGWISVETSRTENYGKTRFQEDPSGPHRIAVEADRDKVVSFFMESLLAGESRTEDVRAVFA